MNTYLYKDVTLHVSICILTLQILEAVYNQSTVKHAHFIITKYILTFIINNYILFCTVRSLSFILPLRSEQEIRSMGEKNHDPNLS